MTRLNWSRARKYTKSVCYADEMDAEKGDEASRWIDSKKPRNKKKRRSKKRAPSIQTSGVVVFTDGACEPNPGLGGWGFVVYEDGIEVHSDNGGLEGTTNNAMELTGLMKALEWLCENAGEAVIYSDSQYLVNGCNSWRFSWKKRGWKRGKPLTPVKNKELWIQIDTLLRGDQKIFVRWCKGHSGLKGNERADRLASNGRKTAKA